MNKVIVAEPVYHALPPKVYFNRIHFWKEVWSRNLMDVLSARPLTLGPRIAIRSVRDAAISTALKENATHLFMMDDDVLVPANILSMLIAVDKPIVGGLMHKNNGDPLVWRDCPGGEEVWVDHPKQGAFDCAAVAAGCMLIKIEVLRTLRPSAYWLFNYDDTPRSMDVLFCRRARRSGFGVWCWPDEPCIQLKHE